MQNGTYPLRRRGSHPGHGPTRSESRPGLHPYQFVPAQQQPQMSPYGPDYLPMNPPTPMFAVNPLAPGQGGAFVGAPGYAPAPQPQAPHPGLAYRPAPAQPQVHHGRPVSGGAWPADPAYGAPPPWWGFRPDQEPEESPSPSEFASTIHPLFNVEAKDQLLHELDGHTIKLPADWQSWPLTVPHPSFNPKQARNPHTRALTAEPAIDPKVHKLRLLCRYLPWPIDVFPSQAKSPSKSPKKKAEGEAFVTVGDVLTAIHRSLQLGITEGEYFIGSEEDRERINNAFRDALKRKERAKDEGVKRVDFLGDRNICVGFRLPESEREEKWIKERLVTGGEWKAEDVWILEVEEPDEE